MTPFIISPGTLSNVVIADDACFKQTDLIPYGI